ncbi:MAG: heme lyase CcmF/NrfE family subunit [Pseudomonadota bacterium]|nr:heme lyase CcmF/NrfE family subunit [Pseudomonadota bacterium]
MIVEIGHFALILALCVAVTQSAVPMIGAHQNNRGWMAVAGPTAVAQLGLLLISFFALMYAYVTSDFSVKNVAANSNSLKPMIYKISGVWGNHEGSMLLWVLILALFGAIVAGFGRNLPPGLKARTLAVQALVSVGFLLFIILTSNPFERLVPAPIDGRGLNPLLQDPGLALHPPILYAGYVGFSISFSFAVAALIEGKVDAAWARWVRPWTLLAWLFLTAGIALGSWWAYYELGWGGWWYWDPVENASFMPWLVGTALLHSAIVVEKRDALKSWTILLAILTFSLSLIGTFLVRSGVLTSVHAFATDPERGVFILLLLVIAIGGSLALYAWRAPQLQSGGLFQPISREGGLVLNNLLLTTSAATVFLGTLYPLFLEAFGGGKVSVGPPFFNATFIPLMVPLVIALGVGPLLPWKRADLGGVLARLKLAFAAALILTLITAYLTWGKSVFGAMGIGIAVWLGASVLVEFGERIGFGRVSLSDSVKRAIGLPRAAWGRTLAHFGLAVTVAGVTGAGLWQVESIQIMRPGDKVEVSGYEFTFEGAENVRGPNYGAERGTFTVRDDGQVVAKLSGERRRYFVSGDETTEAGIHTTAMYDLYAVLGEPNGKGGWTTRLYYKPLVPWLWLGSIIMVLGGIVSLTDRRLRIGAPSRRSSRAVPAPAE